MFNFIKNWFAKPEPKTVRDPIKVESKHKYKKHRKGSKAYWKTRAYHLKKKHEYHKPTIPANHDEICPACNPNSKMTVQEYCVFTKQELGKNARSKMNQAKFLAQDFITHDRNLPKEIWVEKDDVLR